MTAAAEFDPLEVLETSRTRIAAASARLKELEVREQLLADYAAVMGETDAVNSRKPFDAFLAGKLAARHASILLALREAGERVWEERRTR